MSGSSESAMPSRQHLRGICQEAADVHCHPWRLTYPRPSRRPRIKHCLRLGNLALAGGVACGSSVTPVAGTYWYEYSANRREMDADNFIPTTQYKQTKRAEALLLWLGG